MPYQAADDKHLLHVEAHARALSGLSTASKQETFANMWPLTALWFSSITMTLAYAKCCIGVCRGWMDNILCMLPDTTLSSVFSGHSSEERTYLSLITLVVSTIGAICAAIRINQSRTLMGFSVGGAFLGAMVWSKFLPATVTEFFIVAIPLSYSMGATTGVVWSALFA